MAKGKKSLIDQFEALGEEVVNKASAIKCSSNEFLAGLEAIASIVEAAIQDAHDDISREEEEAEEALSAELEE